LEAERENSGIFDRQETADDKLGAPDPSPQRYVNAVEKQPNFAETNNSRGNRLCQTWQPLRPFLAIETGGLTVKVTEGVLHYGGTYDFYLIVVSTTNELMDVVGPVTFTTPVKPSDEDNYGNPLIAQGLKDVQGRDIPLGDNKLGTLIAAGAGILPQLALLTETKNANGVLKDQSGNTITTMNTDDVRVILSKGGLGKEVVIAPSGTNLLEMIRPLSDTGYSMDKTGKMNPYLTIVSSNINLPLGLFDFSISIAT